MDNDAVHSDLLDDLERQEPSRHVKSTILPNTPDPSTAFLDGLRGLATLAVFVQHYIGSFDANVHQHGFGENGHWYLASLPFLRVIFSGGPAAIPVFFVLSGYVLSKSSLSLVRDGRRRACANGLASAVIRRPIRLYLPLLGVSLVFALLMHVPGDFVPDAIWPTPRATLGAELRHWLIESLEFLSPFQSHGSSKHKWYSYDVVAWVVPVELKGSMLIYALMAIYLFSRSPLPIGMPCLVTAAILLLYTGVWTMACFVAGLILAVIDVNSLDSILVYRHHLTKRTESILHYAIFVVAWYLLSQPAHDGEPQYSYDSPGWHYLHKAIPPTYDNDQYYRFWHSWGAFLLVYSSLRIQRLQTFFNRRALRYLGRMSFMLYLTHIPVTRILGDRIGRPFGHQPIGAATSWWDNRLYIPDVGPVGLSTRFLVCLAVMLLSSLAVANAGVKLLDIPSVRLGALVTRKLRLNQGEPRRKEVEMEESISPGVELHGIGLE